MLALSFIAGIILLIIASPLIMGELYQDGDIADLINEL